MNQRATSRPRNGFTLIEMLIALLVFAVIAGGALTLLRFSVDAEGASRTKTAEIAAARRFLAVWTADLAQAVPRAARDEGGELHPAMMAGRDGDLIQLTRSGWDNPLGEARPSLQRVTWRVEADRLVRMGLPFPDGAAAPEPSAMARLAGRPRLRFRAAQGNWMDRWEPERMTDLPSAIELRIPQADGTELAVVALVGASYQ